jgi:hypothetical protein
VITFPSTRDRDFSILSAIFSAFIFNFHNISFFLSPLIWRCSEQTSSRCGFFSSHDCCLASLFSATKTWFTVSSISPVEITSHSASQNWPKVLQFGPLPPPQNGRNSTVFLTQPIRPGVIAAQSPPSQFIQYIQLLFKITSASQQWRLLGTSQSWFSTRLIFGQ